MSGGSYNYLSSREPSEQFDQLAQGDAERAAGSLRPLLALGTVKAHERGAWVDRPVDRPTVGTETRARGS